MQLIEKLKSLFLREKKNENQKPNSKRKKEFTTDTLTKIAKYNSKKH